MQVAVMRRSTRMLCLLPVLIAIACSDHAAPPVAAVVDPHTFDFGTVFEGEVVRHEFVIHNDSTTPITFIGTKSSCGCVRTAEPVIGGTVAPGGDARIPIELETVGRLGRQSTDAVIETRGGSRSEFRLRMSGLVTRFAVFEPPEVRLKVGPSNSDARTRARMSWPRGACDPPTSVSASSPWFSASIVHVDSESCYVEIAVHRGAPVGLHNGEFAKVLTPGSRVDQVFLPVKIEVLPAISIEPSIGVNFGAVAVGTTVDRTVVVRPNEGAPTIHAVEVGLGIVLPKTAPSRESLGFVWQDLRQLPDGSHEVRLSFSPVAAAGNVVGRLLFTTDANREAPVAMAFSMRVGEAGSR